MVELDANLNNVMTKLGVSPTVLADVKDQKITDLTYGDLERIIKFVSQNNPVRWYDGENYWKTSAFSLFNKYPAFDVTDEKEDKIDGKIYTLFPRLCVDDASNGVKVYLLITDDANQVSSCIKYANKKCLTGSPVTAVVEGKECQFIDPSGEFVNLSSFLVKASQGVKTVEPPQHVKDTMNAMPKGGSNSKTKFKRSKARRRTHAVHRHNKVQQRHLERMGRAVAN